MSLMTSRTQEFYRNRMAQQQDILQQYKQIMKRNPRPGCQQRALHVAAVNARQQAAEPHVAMVICVIRVNLADSRMLSAAIVFAAEYPPPCIAGKVTNTT
ncbi:uncharacterized protein EMH_0059890 [Eimeria mitis]|uniref:Uncharacterized protein n=1 Tax=Eimeria mitis TaxID=44415 RepID=U6K0U3_9EIME|nr:uncharacterized protein EMH_0059890 [Eimeria mitis]CDJ30616.1 hypothetical protein EMH_0059890 [Eimeria mitis]